MLSSGNHTEHTFVLVCIFKTNKNLLELVMFEFKMS